MLNVCCGKTSKQHHVNVILNPFVIKLDHTLYRVGIGYNLYVYKYVKLHLHTNYKCINVAI